MVPCCVLGRCLTALWSLASREGEDPTQNICTSHYMLHLFLDCQVKIILGIKLGAVTWPFFLLHHKFNFWSSFWFLIKTWLTPEQACESTSAALSRCVHFHVQSGWFCKKRISELLWFTRTRAGYHTSKLQDQGIWFHCTLHMFSLLQWLWSLSKQLLHHLH